MNDSRGTVVRILEISLKDHNNVCNGRIKTADISNVENNILDIRGIYGQNGSGKTSIIDAIGLIKMVLMGKSLPEDVHECITYGKDQTEIEVLFYIENDIGKYKVRYNIVIEKNGKESFIKREEIYYWDKVEDDSKWSKQKGLIINKNNKNYILPRYRYDEIIRLYDEESDFIVDKKINFKDRKSLIFSDEFIGLINKNLEKIGKEYLVLQILRHYATYNLFIIDNKQLALSDANILLSINPKNNRFNKGISMEVMSVGLEEPTYLSKETIDEIQASLVSSNRVINEIIPGLTIKLKELGARTAKSGTEEIQVELFSCRDEVEIPMRYESDGIKKIIAILHLLIAMFNYNSITVLIDELDSGIFEYLLGEILEILEERGKGQLIFTSHNLRPLEVLDKNNLIFTTTNPNNRYIKLKNVKTNNNLRDMYYRDLVLGGQEENIYDSTNSARIARAFRKAGE